jgi:hypothetical protein
VEALLLDRRLAERLHAQQHDPDDEPEPAAGRLDHEDPAAAFERVPNHLRDLLTDGP